MPYASVILPVHSRSGTLPWSLRSIQNQSERDIEIIIVGDGCTEDVKSICISFAQMDNRIRFLDLPKAPGADENYRLRALAVEKAVIHRMPGDAFPLSP